MEQEKKQPQPGDPVVWHDPTGKAHNAIITAGWSWSTVNLVVVSSDDTKQDSYGRQIERHTSQQHGSVMKVHGNYWRWPEEEPNPYVPPAAV